MLRPLLLILCPIVLLSQRLSPVQPSGYEDNNQWPVDQQNVRKSFDPSSVDEFYGGNSVSTTSSTISTSSTKNNIGVQKPAVSSRRVVNKVSGGQKVSNLPKIESTTRSFEKVDTNFPEFHPSLDELTSIFPVPTTTSMPRTSYRPTTTTTLPTTTTVLPVIFNQQDRLVGNRVVQNQPSATSTFYRNPTQSYRNPAQSYRNPAQSYRNPAQSYRNPASSYGQFNSVSPSEYSTTPRQFNPTNQYQSGPDALHQPMPTSQYQSDPTIQYQSGRNSQYQDDATSQYQSIRLNQGQPTRPNQYQSDPRSQYEAGPIDKRPNQVNQVQFNPTSRYEKNQEALTQSGANGAYGPSGTVQRDSNRQRQYNLQESTDEPRSPEASKSSEVKILESNDPYAMMTKQSIEYLRKNTPKVANSSTTGTNFGTRFDTNVDSNTGTNFGTDRSIGRQYNPQDPQDQYGAQNYRSLNQRDPSESYGSVKQPYRSSNIPSQAFRNPSETYRNPSASFSNPQTPYRNPPSNNAYRDPSASYSNPSAPYSNPSPSSTDAYSEGPVSLTKPPGAQEDATRPYNQDPYSNSVSTTTQDPYSNPITTTQNTYDASESSTLPGHAGRAEFQSQALQYASDQAEPPPFYPQRDSNSPYNVPEDRLKNGPYYSNPGANGRQFLASKDSFNPTVQRYSASEDPATQYENRIPQRDRRILPGRTQYQAPRDAYEAPASNDDITDTRTYDSNKQQTYDGSPLSSEYNGVRPIQPINSRDRPQYSANDGLYGNRLQNPSLYRQNLPGFLESGDREATATSRRPDGTINQSSRFDTTVTPRQPDTTVTSRRPWSNVDSQRSNHRDPTVSSRRPTKVQRGFQNPKNDREDHSRLGNRLTTTTTSFRSSSTENMLPTTDFSTEPVSPVNARKPKPHSAGPEYRTKPDTTLQPATQKSLLQNQANINRERGDMTREREGINRERADINREQANINRVNEVERSDYNGQDDRRITSTQQNQPTSSTGFRSSPYEVESSGYQAGLQIDRANTVNYNKYRAQATDSSYDGGQNLATSTSYGSQKHATSPSYDTTQSSRDTTYDGYNIKLDTSTGRRRDETTVSTYEVGSQTTVRPYEVGSQTTVSPYEIGSQTTVPSYDINSQTTVSPYDSSQTTIPRQNRPLQTGQYSNPRSNYSPYNPRPEDHINQYRTRTQVQNTGYYYRVPSSSQSPYDRRTSTVDPYDATTSSGNAGFRSSTVDLYDRRGSTVNPYDSASSTVDPYNTRSSTVNPNRRPTSAYESTSLPYINMDRTTARAQPSIDPFPLPKALFVVDNAYEAPKPTNVSQSLDEELRRLREKLSRIEEYNKFTLDNKDSKSTTLPASQGYDEVVFNKDAESEALFMNETLANSTILNDQVMNDTNTSESTTSQATVKEVPTESLLPQSVTVIKPSKHKVDGDTQSDQLNIETTSLTYLATTESAEVTESFTETTVIPESERSGERGRETDANVKISSNKLQKTAEINAKVDDTTTNKPSEVTEEEDTLVSLARQNEIGKDQVIDETTARLLKTLKEDVKLKSKDVQNSVVAKDKDGRDVITVEKTIELLQVPEKRRETNETVDGISGDVVMVKKNSTNSFSETVPEALVEESASNFTLNSITNITVIDVDNDTSSIMKSERNSTIDFSTDNSTNTSDDSTSTTDNSTSTTDDSTTTTNDNSNLTALSTDTTNLSTLNTDATENSTNLTTSTTGTTVTSENTDLSTSDGFNSTINSIVTKANSTDIVNGTTSIPSETNIIFRDDSTDSATTSTNNSLD
ncbi:unnamed protein product [Bursaphelenchus okinawaensis]|uniref:Uncharacterized protein n=1 Tax=Bursaphelenchus okinawaensis TaxID=465554 RepID=A0A811LEF8_9BILA|nr:unnamed protein product [Bursaphelenchus okinawaensis]CAG9121696.1 unnamed protein product [Bursaphelenchus okinawaensis]